MTATNGKGRARSVPVLYGAITAALLVAVVGLALSSPPPRTPPLAAVNPQVEEQVEVERVEQSSQFGEGQGGEGDCAPGDEGCVADGAEQGTDPNTPSTPQATSAPADFWPCVVGPGGPRQTEDPQSPPCIGERFSGDNGGATWRGVTATEIRIAYDPNRHSLSKHPELLPALVAHFNRHYELYGRQLTMVPMSYSGEVADPAVQRAHASEVVDAGVFASFDYSSFGAFQRDLAGNGVMNVTGVGSIGLISEAAIAGLDPHVWSVNPSLEEALAATGDLICGALSGRPAQHGGADVARETRRFGVLAEQPSSKGVHFDAGLLRSRLEACRADHVTATYSEGSTDPAVLLRRLREQGVTTIVCVCAGLDDRYLDAAEALGYQPEWLLPGIDDGGLNVRTMAARDDDQPRTQIAHVFGLTPRLRRPVQDYVRGRQAIEEQYWYHAARQADPNFVDHYSVGTAGYDIYVQFLVLASGIQWAGPDLNPEAFGAALKGLRYPNPGVGQAPWWQPSAGFGPSDHSFTSDFSMLWWRAASDADYQAKTDFGEMCYVGGGRRFVAGRIPADADERLFNLEAGCR